jgi:surface polysaccharide O-acyltransferase-like enzyme
MAEVAERVPAAQPATAAEKPDARPIIHWVDLIRVVAIFLVVVIHTSGQLTNIWGKIPESEWIIGDIYGGIARISVPLFFMLSGYLLLPRTESLGSFYRKRIPKIIIPFVAWSILYIGVDCLRNPGLCTPDYLMQYVLLRKTYFHLWFLYSLLGIYIIMPLLRLMVRPGTEKLLWYVVGLWLLFQPVRTLMDQFLHFSLNFNSQLAVGFLPYFFLGYLLGQVRLGRGWLAAAWAMFVLGSAVTVVGTYIVTRNAGQFNGYFYDYTTIGVIPASAGGFLLLRRLSDAPFLSTERAHAFLRWVAGGTFGAYLIHVFFIYVLEGLGFSTLMGSGVWTIPLVAAVTFTLAFLATRLLQKIPVIKEIVPG